MPSQYAYHRRMSWPVSVGNVTVGGDAPVVIQSMTSTSTMDTEGSAAQIERIAGAGGQIVRLTAQGVREASNLAEIRRLVRSHGCGVPLVADIHFNPNAAFEAARHVEKVRINPGNFVDPGRVFRHIDYTDGEYAAEQERIARTFVPFLDLCRENGTAVRIGVNHGSLSDRIMSRYGDTPAGMVESAMEFLRIAVAHDFRNIMISIKASNTVIMVETVFRLVKAMDSEDMHFPLHLGVTEAGAGDDGRIKSAVGIGTLLAHGIGDTVRVSLSEDPECEIPVARDLVDHVSSGGYVYAPDRSVRGCRFYTEKPVVAMNADGKEAAAGYCIVSPGPESDNQLGDIYATIASVSRSERRRPCVAHFTYDGLTPDEVRLRAASDAGTLLLCDMADGIWIEAGSMSAEELAQLELDILQAARCRFTKTEFISCPGCGRTLFDLQSTVKRVKESVSHLRDLRIAVMGCVVNGPGEMADADYGYVGAAAGKVSLYRGKVCVERNIPQEEALDHLVKLLKDDGRWLDPKTRF